MNLMPRSQTTNGVGFEPQLLSQRVRLVATTFGVGQHSLAVGLGRGSPFRHFLGVLNRIKRVHRD
jgi:hypothetical protein